MAEEKGYKTEVTVVRRGERRDGTGVVWTERNFSLTREPASLFRGGPMVGDKVRTPGGSVQEVVKVRLSVLTNHGSSYLAEELTPYDPEAEKVERVARAIREKIDRKIAANEVFPSVHVLARAAIAAMEASDD